MHFDPSIQALISLRKMALKAVTFLGLFCSVASAGLIVDSLPYQSGKQRYMNLDEAFKNVHGRFVVAPLDYEKPSRGSFDLFYRISENFDFAKPTILFFEGGPGISISDISFEKALPNFNFIYFDYRGAGFSHLRTLNDLNNPLNYSSELIAKDAELLRKTIGVERVSIWANSYGTAPATIYASKFASHVSAVVLEGVLYNGAADLWMTPRSIKMIQDYYDHLDSETQARVSKFSAADQPSRDWFSQLVRYASMSSEMYKLADEMLKEKLFALEQNSEFWNGQTVIPDYDSTEYSAYMYQHTACQELGIGSGNAALGAELRNGKFTPYVDPEIRHQCLLIPGMEARLNRTYEASLYPLTVPVTYFQGTADGLTDPIGAMKHFKKVACAKTQLVYVVGGGHGPIASCLQDSVTQPPSESGCKNQKNVAEALSRGLLGENISKELLERLSRDGHRWAKASKLRPEIPN